MRDLKFLKIFVTGLAIFAVVLPLVSASAQTSQFCELEGSGGLIKVPCPLQNERTPVGAQSFGNLIIIILQIALLVVGSVAVAFLIYGGFRYITAYGNEEHAETAKRIMRQAILGLIVVVLSFAIITVITNILVASRT